MSFSPIEDAHKSDAQLDALVNDVQNLLHAFAQVKAENVLLKQKITEQEAQMKNAHDRLLSLVKRLPSGLPSI